MPEKLPPNGPELSCGDVQPDHRRLYARETPPFPNRPTTRGEIVDGGSSA